MDAIPNINDELSSIALYLTKGGLLGAIGGLGFFGVRLLLTNQNVELNQFNSKLRLNVPYMKNEVSLCSLFYHLQNTFGACNMVMYETALKECDEIMCLKKSVSKLLKEYKIVLSRERKNVVKQHQMYNTIINRRQQMYNLWRQMGKHLRDVYNSVYEDERERFDTVHEITTKYQMEREKFDKEHNLWSLRKQRWEILHNNQSSFSLVNNQQSSTFPEPEPVAPVAPPENLSDNLRTNICDKIVSAIIKETMQKIKSVE